MAPKKPRRNRIPAALPPQGGSQPGPASGAVSGTPSRTGFYIAAAVYAAWIVFLLILAILQR